MPPAHFRTSLTVFSLSAVACAAIFASSAVQAGTIDSTVNGFVRAISGVPSGSNPDGVQILSSGGIEDHGVLEFGMSTITGQVSSATVTLTKFSTFGAIDFSVFAYAGNGTLDLSDFSAGSLVISDVAYHNEATVTFDITPFINAIVGVDTFAGLSLRPLAGGVDDFDANGTEIGRASCWERVLI